jgi:hypothetical protein
MQGRCYYPLGSTLQEKEGFRIGLNYEGGGNRKEINFKYQLYSPISDFLISVGFIPPALSFSPDIKRV